MNQTGEQGRVVPRMVARKLPLGFGPIEIPAQKTMCVTSEVPLGEMVPERLIIAFDIAEGLFVRDVETEGKSFFGEGASVPARFFSEWTVDSKNLVGLFGTSEVKTTKEAITITIENKRSEAVNFMAAILGTIVREEDIEPRPDVLTSAEEKERFDELLQELAEKGSAKL